MKRSILSEKSLVVIMFIIVVVIFSFAQADSKEIEKGYINTNSSATAGQAENAEANLKTTQTEQIIPSVQLR